MLSGLFQLQATNSCITAQTLSRLYLKSMETLRDVKHAFNELTAGRDPELVAQWETESVKPYQNRKGQWESVYRLKAEWDEGAIFTFLLFQSLTWWLWNDISGPRTQGQKFQKLCADEESSFMPAGQLKGNAAFMNAGLRLEA